MSCIEHMVIWNVVIEIEFIKKYNDIIWILKIPLIMIILLFGYKYKVTSKIYIVKL